MVIYLCIHGCLVAEKKQEGTASIWLGRGGGGGKSLASSEAGRPFCPPRRGMLISHKRERKESPNAVKAAKKRRGNETGPHCTKKCLLVP